jgi:hypothetical protein
MEEPNTFYTTGSCDNCGHVTDIAKNGCNYLLAIPLRGLAAPGTVRMIETGYGHGKH